MDDAELSGTEQVIFGRTSLDAVTDRLNRYLTQYLGVAMSEVLFRAGRIDAVWAVRTDDGREVVVKAHRQPVDLVARTVTARAQQLLVGASFPCPTPLSGPDQLDDLVLSVETLLVGGSVGDGRDPATRRSIAGGLADHIDILRGSGPTSLAGRGPAWCQYHGGPWPVPHDSIFDFDTSPRGFEWLDSFAREAADRLIDAVHPDEMVVGHADWYCGNLRFDGSRLVAAFDWDLVAITEPVLAGFSAATYAAGGSAADVSSPEEVAAFLTDYDSVTVQPFTPRQQGVAAAAAAWTIAYNARCELSLLTGPPAAGSTLDTAQQNQEEYLRLRW